MDGWMDGWMRISSSTDQRVNLLFGSHQTLPEAPPLSPTSSSSLRRAVMMQSACVFSSSVDCWFIRDQSTAVKLNVLVDGQPWDDAPDLQDEEDLDLESLLDDTILETTKRRRLYPRRILPHVVQALKAERKILVGSYFFFPLIDIQKDPDQGQLRLSCF
uniref:Uncharacterized protein n=1 Tax=Cyprinodon variegatus TaxID=28743 RepID=A0A3Q2G5G1_CYPVA